MKTQISIFITGIIMSVSLIIVFNDFNVNANEYKNTIIWKADYKGDVFSDQVYFSGDNQGYMTGEEPEKAGYADGNGNYFITEFSLPVTKTLVIQPGITIIFTEYGSNFEIWGNLYAEGTKEKPIIFRSETGLDEARSYQAWGDIDINFMNNTNEPVFKHCYLYHGSIVSRRGINIENSFVFHSYGISAYGYGKWKARIIDCSVTSHAELEGVFNGIDALDCTDVELIDNTLSGNSSHIFARGEKIICKGNELTDNGGILLLSRGSDDPIFKDNILINASMSIYGNFTVEENYLSNPSDEFVLYIRTEMNPVVNNNTIIGNVSLYGDTQKRPVDLRYNYWGTVDSEKINRSIQRNPRDDIVHEYVYEPYLDEDMKIYVYQPSNDYEPFRSTEIILIMIGVIILILVILLVLFILYMKRGKNSTYIEEEPVPVIELGNS